EDPMFSFPERPTSAERVGLEALRTILSTSLDGVGRLTGLSVQTARTFAARAARNLNALSDARDLQGLAAVQTPMVMTAVDQSLAYSRRAFEICSESSNALLKVLEGQLGDFAGGLTAVLGRGR
ncbi:MAG: phasin family protein, partial [Thiobacillaceae bacterium]|nr:phasin family protein [Thiobacillaceae bacterium]